MAASTLVFIYIGAAVVTGNLMKFVLWLDDPHSGDSRRRPRRHARAY